MAPEVVPGVVPEEMPEEALGAAPKGHGPRNNELVLRLLPGVLAAVVRVPPTAVIQIVTVRTQTAAIADVLILAVRGDLAVGTAHLGVLRSFCL